MDSAGGMKRDVRYFKQVYVRRRRGTGFGKVVPDLDLNIPLLSESSLPKTDGSPEIGDDGPLSPALDFLETPLIQRRKRSTLNRRPHLHVRPSSPPPTQVCDHSTSIPSPVDSHHSRPLAAPSTGTIARSPPPPSADRPKTPADAFAPGEIWRCPTCLKIDVDGLSMPIKYLKKSNSKKGMQSKKVKDNSCSIGTKSNDKSKLAIIDNQV